MNARLQFDFNDLGDRKAPRDRALAVTVYGDFSGRGADGGGESSGELRRITFETLDEVLAEIAPSVDLGEGMGRLPFAAVEDFAADSLLERLSVFAEIRAFRKRLRDPGEFSRAAAEFDARFGRAEQPAPQTVAEGQSTALHDAQDGLADLLERPSGAEASTTLTGGARSIIDSLLKKAAADSTVATPAAGADAYLSRADDIAGRLLRDALSNPAFRTLESLWRSVEFLLARLDPGDETTVTVRLADVSREGFLRTAAEGGLSGWLPEADGECRRVCVPLYDFGTIGEASAVAKFLGAFADAVPSRWFLGLPQSVCDRLLELGRDPESATRLETSPGAVLLGPRFMLRLPYGSKGEECRGLAFEEQSVPPEHDRFLWGNSGLLAAVVACNAYAGTLRASSAPEIGDLPVFAYRAKSEPRVYPCAERFLSEEEAVLLGRAGVLAVESVKGSDSVRLHGGVSARD